MKSTSVPRPGAAALGRRAGRAWQRLLVATILPPTCCLCGASGQPPAIDLCEICAASLPRATPACAPWPPVFDLVCVPFRYAYPVNHFVRRFKYQSDWQFGRVLGEYLAEARRAADMPLPQLIVPVPLHRLRYRERGFNQAERLAHYAASRLGPPVAPQALVRSLPTRPQSGLDAADRRRNLRNAFVAPHKLPARHVALVDDVLTTGSTALEAARVLRDAGADRLELWTAARATLDAVSMS